MARTLARAAAALTALTLTLTGCVTEFAAEKVVAPPNGGRYVAFNASTVSGFIDRGFRVDVGPPHASLMVWVVEPKLCDVVTTRDLHALPTPTDGQRWSQMKTGPTRQGVSAGIWQVIRFHTPGTVAAARDRLEPRGTVLLLQGYSCHTRRNAYLWPVAAFLADAGYRVVMPDLRGHGDSTGGSFTWGVQETRDLAQLVDRLEDEGLLAGKLAVVGHSTGASVAIAAAAHDPRVATAVALSPWRSMREAIRGFRDWKLPWSRPLLNDGVLDLVVNRAGRLGGFDPRLADATRWIRTTNKPVLILHGGADPLLPPEHGEAIYAARPDNTELIIYPGDDHWSHLELHYSDVRRRCLDWLDRHMPPQQPATPIAATDGAQGDS